MHRVNVAAVTVVVALGLLVAFAFPASAQSVTAYEGARLIVGDGRVIENATLVVEGARIAQVGPTADVRVPAGGTRVSLAGKTVMPMIVDTHTHLNTTREGLIRDLKQRAFFGVSGALSLGLDGFELLDVSPVRGVLLNRVTGFRLTVDLERRAVRFDSGDAFSRAEKARGAGDELVAHGSTSARAK